MWKPGHRWPRHCIISVKPRPSIMPTRKNLFFPRLRQAADPRAQAVLDKLAALEDEHRWAAPLHEQIDQLGTKFLTSGPLAPEEVEAFRSAIAGLVSMYRSHIALEDEVVFPCAAEVLSAKDKAAIAGEMASRRNL